MRVLVKAAIVLEPSEGPVEDRVAQLRLACLLALLEVRLVRAPERVEVFARCGGLLGEDLEEERGGRGEAGPERVARLVDVAGAQQGLDDLRAGDVTMSSTSASLKMQEQRTHAPAPDEVDNGEADRALALAVESDELLEEAHVARGDAEVCCTLHEVFCEGGAPSASEFEGRHEAEDGGRVRVCDVLRELVRVDDAFDAPVGILPGACHARWSV